MRANLGLTMGSLPCSELRAQVSVSVGRHDTRFRGSLQWWVFLEILVQV